MRTIRWLITFFKSVIQVLFTLPLWLSLLILGLSVLVGNYLLYKSTLTHKKIYMWCLSGIYAFIWMIYGIVVFLPQPAVLVSYLTLDTYYYFYLSTLILYLVVGVVLYFGWGLLGVRGIFYLAEFTLAFLLIMTVSTFFVNLCTHMAITLNLGTIVVSENLAFCCHVQFDLLSILSIFVVLILTGIVLVFGIEYMTREALAYNVVTTLMIFSACIVWFLISYAWGILSFFWEGAGIFSLFLIDMYYSRIRTTQAVSRSFAITRFSDLFVLFGGTESYLLCGNDTFSSLFSILPPYFFNLSFLFAGIFEVTSATLILFSIFVLAASKCAQFFLFVWLPDAMEAPTPASALIHSSTLVVMGISLILRMAPILHLSFVVLSLMAIVGSLSVLYGSVFAIQTSDLKKAVAYSTISQIGYLFCGCGLLAIREVLLYLVIHAICKALLFVFVGYIVHMFGGTTSLRRMGGLYYIIPDVSIYMFIVCMILAGAPYTIGYYAKDLLVLNVFGSNTLITLFMRCCWTVAFICTPIYLHKVCIIPLFGRPRCSRYTFRNILSLSEMIQYHSLHLFDLTKLQSKVLLFFSKQARALRITGPLASILHFIIIIVLLFCGESLILLLGGFFNTTTLLFGGSAQGITSFAATSLLLQAQHLTWNIIFMLFILFVTIVSYFVFLNNQSHFNVFMHCICIFVFICFICLALGWYIILTII